MCPPVTAATIAAAEDDEPAIQGAVEQAVLDLIADDDEAHGVMQSDELEALVA